MMCFNKKVIVGLVVAAAAIYLFAPNLLGAALPLLIFAVCPLSMLLMMRMMSGSGKGSCATTGAGSDRDAELAQLRGEVERLRTDTGVVHRPSAQVSDGR